MKLIKVTTHKEVHGSEKEAYVNPEHIASIETHGSTGKARISLANGVVIGTTDSPAELVEKLK